MVGFELDGGGTQQKLKGWPERKACEEEQKRPEKAESLACTTTAKGLDALRIL